MFYPHRSTPPLCAESVAGASRARATGASTYNVLTVVLGAPASSRPDVDVLPAPFYTTSLCGVCGRTASSGGSCWSVRPRPCCRPRSGSRVQVGTVRGTSIPEPECGDRPGCARTASSGGSCWSVRPRPCCRPRSGSRVQVGTVRGPPAPPRPPAPPWPPAKLVPPVPPVPPSPPLPPFRHRPRRRCRQRRWRHCRQHLLGHRHRLGRQRS